MDDISFTAWRGSLLLIHYLMHLLENGLPISEMKDSFLLNALKHPTGGLQRNSTETVRALHAFAEEHRDHYPQREESAYVGGYWRALAYMAREYMTNVTNRFKFSLELRLKWNILAHIPVAMLWEHGIHWKQVFLDVVRVRGEPEVCADFRDFIDSEWRLLWCSDDWLELQLRYH